MNINKSLRAFLAAAMLAIAAVAAPGVANAQDVVVERDVTVREGPSRLTDALDFPPVGTRLELLDEGRRTSGYLHVRLPDGREGWVYHTYVSGDAPPPPPPPPPGADSQRMTVHYIDVDQGASALLEFSCGAVLIDAGGRGTAAGNHLIAYLDAFFQRRPDLNRRLGAVFVTHAHFDHNSYLRRVAERYGVGAFVYNGKVDNRNQWMVDRGNARATAFPVVAVTEAEIAAAGTQGVRNSNIDPVDCQGVDPDIRVLNGGRTSSPGWGSREFRNPNNHSLVIRVSFDRSSFLFTGDLETDGIEALVARYRGTTRLNVDVYEVGHHGAENGTTEGLLDATTPQIAVISVGDPNTQGVPMSAHDHGHPRKATLEQLRDAITRQRSAPVDIMVAEQGSNAVFEAFRVSDAIYATSRDGDIRVIASRDGRLEVQTSR
jgi:competence protein ComEC